MSEERITDIKYWQYWQK